MIRYSRMMSRADIDRIVAIERSVMNPPWDETQIRKLLKAEDQECKVYIGDGREPIGYVAFTQHSHRWTIDRLVVDWPWMRMGVGRAMIHELSRQAEKSGVEKLAVTVDERDESALLFFKAIGFQATAVKWGEFGEADGVYMRLMARERVQV